MRMRLAIKDRDHQTDWHGNCRMRGAKDACDRVGYFPPIKHFFSYTRGYLAVKAEPLSDLVYGFGCFISNQGAEMSEHIFSQLPQQRSKPSNLEAQD